MKAFCITLPETPERTAAAKAHFAERGVDGITFVDGIHAETFGLYTTHPYLIDDPKRGGHIIPQRQVGCMLSHFMLWTALSLLDEAGPFLILEDDAEFSEDWAARLNWALKNTPSDVDLLYIGSGLTEDKPKTQVAFNVWEVMYPLCTHAYIVWKKALPVLLSTQRDIWAPVDLSLYFRSLPLLKVYTVLPRIVSQRNMEIAP